MAIKVYSLKKDGNKKLSSHFKVKEFRCKDATDQILLNDQLVPLLEKLFIKLKCSTIIVNSGYRTNSYTVKVGGYVGDQHTKGNAADIRCNKNGKVIPAKEVCCALEELGHNGGVGYISSTSVHVDVRGNKSWFDETNGKTRIASFKKYFGIVSDETYTRYTVKAGDSFWKIAREQMGSGLKCTELASFNGLKLTSVIRPGQVLKIPKK